MSKVESSPIQPWVKLKQAVEDAALIVQRYPAQLAGLGAILERTQSLLDSPPSPEAVAALKLAFKEGDDFLAKWRSNGPALYVPPSWLTDVDRVLAMALRFLSEQDVSRNQANPESSTMKIFVSHSSSDQEIAAAFVDLLRAALPLSAKDIRCTSVDGYRLPGGATSDAQLRQEVFECTSFVALLSPTSIKSVYVLFELGARWGANRHLAPIMVAGLDPSFLKAPLNAIHAARGTSESDMLQLFEEMALRLSVTAENASTYMRALQRFIAAAKAP